MIGMWGSRRAGKTAFISALYQELRRRHEEESNIWRMVGETDAAHELLLRDYSRYIDNQFPEPTPADVLVQPLIYEVTRPLGDPAKRESGATQRSWSGRMRIIAERFWRAGADRETIKLNLFDPSGEFFTDPNRLVQDDENATQCRNMLRESRGLLCFIDPDNADSSKYFPLIYRNFVLLSKLMNGEAGGTLPVPVAIVVTKADQYPDAFREPAGFLRSRMGRTAYGALMDFCDQRAFFAVSSVGAGNVERVSEHIYKTLGELQPQNVWQPVEWLLDAMSGRL